MDNGRNLLRVVQSLYTFSIHLVATVQGRAAAQFKQLAQKRRLTTFARLTIKKGTANAKELVSGLHITAETDPNTILEGKPMRFRSAIIILAALTGGVSGASALELKDITFDTPGAGKVVFSHKVHLTKKSDKLGAGTVSCKSCHTTSATGSRNHFTMADMEKGKSCGKCHTGQRAFSISQCTGCHKVKEITYKVKETGPVLFSHAKHLKTMQCGACHNNIYYTGVNRQVSMAEMEKGKSCGACHDGVKAFSVAKCASCHPMKEIVFKVKETGPTAFSHKIHVERYSCSACHTKLYSIGPKNKRVTMAAMEKGQSCGACHNSKEAFAVAECEKCHSIKGAKSKIKDIKFKVADAGDVKFSHTNHLGMYKCVDCHTRTFRLKTGNKPVTMSQMEKAKSCGACHDGKTAFSVTGNCDSCHAHS
jgi:c(7)-type cytochrome triheme protein